jgi:shikimate kinase
VVHLDVGLAAAMQRLEMNRSRPLLIGNVRGRWQELANERRPLYLEVATVTVATDGMSPADVVEAVVAALSKGAEQ